MTRVDDTEVMRLWRAAGLPEYFLGNGGTNDKLVAFAELIRASLTDLPAKTAVEGQGESGETALELEYDRDIMADALRQIADATGTYVSIAIFAVNTAKQALSAGTATPGGEK